MRDFRVTSRSHEKLPKGHAAARRPWSGALARRVRNMTLVGLAHSKRNAESDRKDETIRDGSRNCPKQQGRSKRSLLLDLAFVVSWQDIYSTRFSNACTTWTEGRRQTTGISNESNSKAYSIVLSEANQIKQLLLPSDIIKKAT